MCFVKADRRHFLVMGPRKRSFYLGPVSVCWDLSSRCDLEAYKASKYGTAYIKAYSNNSGP